MARIMRKFEFDAGHRVWGHESKCAHLHGHRYVAEIIIESKDLDALGRVVDFGVVKDIIGTWIDDNLDHNFLLHAEDPMVLLWERRFDHFQGGNAFDELPDVFGGKAPFIMPKRTYRPQPDNPTAECIAQLLYEVSNQLLKAIMTHNVRVARVTVWETPNCSATYFAWMEKNCAT